MGKNKVSVQILTLKLDNNYGGILQAYALQKAVGNYADDVITTHYEKRFSFYIKLLGYIRRLVYRYVFNKKEVSNLPIGATGIIAERPLEFIAKNIKTSKKLRITKEPSIVIVGSDQVWRSVYADVTRYLFAGVKKGYMKKLSYSASFGKDDLSEYSASLIYRTAQLAKQFAAISVREDNGVELVNKYWGIKANHHVDPTLLLSKEQYEQMVENNIASTHQPEGSLFVYVLDKSNYKREIIECTSKIINSKIYNFMPPEVVSWKNLKFSPDKYRLPSVEQWLRSFRDAKYVVTDSFHGTVFSIIFNKPFIAVGNKSRGLARFTSLLKMFGLEDRLISDISQVTPELINAKINWGKVNAIKDREQKRSMEYLKKHLK